MNSNERFNDSFRLSTFDEIKSIGVSISHNLVGIVQNPVPMTDEDLKYFNSEVDRLIERLNNVKKSVNDEYVSDRLVPFED